MLSVCTFFWAARRREYQDYTAEQVNVLARMVQRNLRIPHEFVCFTDQPKKGFDPSIRLAPLDTNLIPIGNAYPKLALFKPRPDFAERALFIDLDSVVVRDLTPLVERDEPVVLLPEFNVKGRSKAVQSFYNSSFMLIKAGAAPHVWSRFNPLISPSTMRRLRKIGSDQLWISETLGPDMPTWPADDAILSYKYHCRANRLLPASARLVCFHGAYKPWNPQVQAESPWIADHWR